MVIFARLERHATALVVALLICLPVAVKMPVLAGLLVSDSANRYANIEVERSSGITAGGSTIDPNIGYTSHALGTHAAREWMAGRVPWWNPYEGVGVPLAAGMQSAALFPLTPVLLLPRGQLIFHLLLQIIAGLGTFGLLRALRLRRGPAVAGALLFEFNAVFAWMANAVVNPVAFLPFLLWGVEWQSSEIPRRRAWGAAMIAFGLALSLYAGFPEVAYLNGLLVGVWSLVRIGQGARGTRLALCLRIAAPALCGLLLAAPIVVPFLAYLPQAEVGMHDNAGARFQHLASGYALLTLLPYFLGGIFSKPIVAEFWGNVGGYAGLIPLALAGAGLVGRRERALRWALGGWIVACLFLTFGATWLFALISWIPGLKEAALYRYLPASWAMALAVLAAVAIDDALKSDGDRRMLYAGGAVATLGLVLIALDHGTVGWRPRDLYALAATIPQLLIFGGFLIAAGWPRLTPRVRGAIVSVALLAETLWLFGLPVLAHPRHLIVADGGVRFLQRHLGMQRFATLGPISPNYGTYFGIAQVNHNDLPVPASWTTYVRRHLDPGADPILFTRVSSAATLVARQSAYAAIGVRYVVAPPGTAVPELRPVYADRVMAVYELSGAAPYASAPGCRLGIVSRDRMIADCAAPAHLTRLELSMPGWQAFADGRSVPIATAGEIFQRVSLRRGRSIVVFRYRPPYIEWAAAVALGGLLLLAGVMAWSGRRGKGAYFSG